MNAAFLMLTTAWMTGADPAPAAAAPAAPVVSTSMGSCNGGYGNYGGCGSTSDCCEHQRRKLCDRLKGRKHHNDCCEAAPACAPVHQAPVHYAAPAASCGCEDTCKKPGLCARLKGKFHRHNDCCDTGYGYNGGCGGAYGTIGGTAEPIPAAPKPATGQPMPSKPTSTTPITMSGVITNVTPVGAPASPF